MQLGDRARVVLGNHDLHFLAVAAGYAKHSEDDHLDDLLNDAHLSEYTDWMRKQALLHHDPDTGFTMIHAGLTPQWDLLQAQACAAELEQVLRSDDINAFLQEMYGNKPKRWSDDLTGMDRLRCITNAFTRLRYCKADGTFCLKAKGPIGSQPEKCLPWFQVPNRASRGLQILFGHWSTLGPYHEQGIYALDSGCLWGGKLTALRLEDRQWFQVDCQAYREIG